MRRKHDSSMVVLIERCANHRRLIIAEAVSLLSGRPSGFLDGTCVV
jgi:hypothetical protein